MFKALGFLLKITLFSLIVLVLGNWLVWDGRTISDQVRLRMSHAEKSDTLANFRQWAQRLLEDARLGFKKHTSQNSEDEDISPSERQKLKALIRELNGSR